MTNKKTVLILCTGNSARSQMAEGLLKHMCGTEYNVESAGTKPSLVRPEAIQALSEIGIDISKNRSKSVEEFTDKRIDYVLTVCDNAREICPYFPAQTKIIHHSFEDPADAAGDYQVKLSAFRKIRDEIKDYFESGFLDDIQQEAR